MHNLILSHDIATSSTSPSTEDLLILQKLQKDATSTSTSTSTSEDLILIKEQETNSATCFVCMSELPKENFSFSRQLCDDSNHQTYCNGCLSDYLQIKLKDGEFNFSFCLGLKCKGKTSLSPEDKLKTVQSLVHVEYYEKYEKHLLESCLLKMRNMVWCPNKSCSAPVLVSISRKDAFCSSCNTTFCWKCSRDHHYGTCPPESKGTDPIDSLTYEWIKTKTKPCPRCNIQIEKNGGCDHMYCSRCQFHFNWSQSESNTVKVPFIVTQVRRSVPSVSNDRVSDDVFVVYGPRAKPKFNPSILTRSCSVCKSKVEKVHSRSNNNHITCSNCKTKICFLCGDVAKTTAHFHHDQETTTTNGTTTTTTTNGTIKCTQHTSFEVDTYLLSYHYHQISNRCGSFSATQNFKTCLPSKSQKSQKSQKLKQKDSPLFEGEDDDFEFYEYFC